MILAQGLFEVHLTVADLDRAVAFYRDFVGLRVAHIESARQVAFLWIGAAANSVVGVAATLETHGIAIATARRTSDRMRHPTAMRPVIFGWMEQKYG